MLLVDYIDFPVFDSALNARPVMQIKDAGVGNMQTISLYLTLQNQSFAEVSQNMCFSKFRKFHIKISVSESFLNKISGLKVINGEALQKKQSNAKSSTCVINDKRVWKNVVFEFCFAEWSVKGY